MFALLDKVNSDMMEDDIDNLRNNSDTEFVLEENWKNELDYDDKLLNLLVPKANYLVVVNPIIEKRLEEGISKAEKEV